MDGTVKGVNTSYLYVGTWRSTFCFHHEDLNLASINTLFFGDPKLWWVIPPKCGHLLEKLAKDTIFKDKELKSKYASCRDFLMHKACMFSPEILDKHGIPYNKIVQRKNETVITSPYAYHGGFNTGFNLAEATNFATEKWLPYAKQSAKPCCQDLGLPFPIGPFIKKYESEGSFAMWEAKMKTPHPELSQEKKLIAMQRESEDISKRYLKMKEQKQKLQLTLEKKKFSAEYQQPSKKITRNNAMKSSILSSEIKDKIIDAVPMSVKNKGGKKIQKKKKANFQADPESKEKNETKTKQKRGQKLKTCSEPGCTHETYRADNFKRHQEKHEREKAKQSKQVIQVKSEKCQQCGKTFIRKDTLEKHINSIHLGIKRFKCPRKKCLHETYAKSDMEKHVRICKKK